MNRTAKVMTLVICSLWIGAEQAHAQQRYVDPSALPRGDKFHTARKKIQIVDETPEITSVPHGPEAQKILVIQMPQHKTPAPEIIYANPGAGGGGLSGLPPGSVALDLNQLPKSRLGPSNIPAGGFVPKHHLPLGQSTNGLLNKMVQGRMNAPTSRVLNAGSVPQGRIPVAEQKPMVYDRDHSYPVSANGNCGSKSSSSVSAKLVDRGSLLGKAK